MTDATPPPDPGEDELVTIRETAEILAVSIQTLRRWDADGHLRSVRLYPGGPRRYRRSDIDALLRPSA